MSTRHRTEVLIAALGLLLVACGSSTADANGSIRDQVKAISAQASAAGAAQQAAMLADGVVTEAEYRRATLSMLDCAERRGLVVYGPTSQVTIFGLQLQAAWGPPEGSTKDVTAIGDRCQNERQIFVTGAWGIQYGDRMTDRAQPLMRKCLAAKGVSIGTERSYAKVSKKAGFRVAGRCQSDVTAGLNPVDPSSPPPR